MPGLDVFIHSFGLEQTRSRSGAGARPRQLAAQGAAVCRAFGHRLAVDESALRGLLVGSSGELELPREQQRPEAEHNRDDPRTECRCFHHKQLL